MVCFICRLFWRIIGQLYTIGHNAGPSEAHGDMACLSVSVRAACCGGTGAYRQTADRAVRGATSTGEGQAAAGTCTVSHLHIQMDNAAP